MTGSSHSQGLDYRLPHHSSISFLGYILDKAASIWTRQRLKPLLPGLSPPPTSSCSDSWASLTFTRNSDSGFSTVTAPLTALTYSRYNSGGLLQHRRPSRPSKPSSLQPPILMIPYPERQFVVEVDASGMGVEAVLSQQSPDDQKLNPCAFFSRHLSPAKRNYDISNQTLLAVKLALEEWCHWLEGAKLPFLVWTDHKNLKYISSAKRLNSYQAQWSLFLTWFKLSLSYRPCSRNAKPDALS